MMLVYDPAGRISAKQACNHPYFEEYLAEQQEEVGRMMATIIRERWYAQAPRDADVGGQTRGRGCMCYQGGGRYHL